MEYPAKGTILAPLATWKSYRGVFLSSSPLEALEALRMLPAAVSRPAESEVLTRGVARASLVKLFMMNQLAAMNEIKEQERKIKSGDW
jgi:hypothetical protein